MKKRILTAFLSALLLMPLLPVLPLGVSGKEYEKRKTPIMGWASWNAYRTDITEEIILSQAHKLKELGLAELGYTFVNVDDGWQYGRGKDGYVNTNLTKFPSGMKYVSDSIHALGLNAGIYTDAGAKTCGWVSDNQTENDDVGLYGHDESDLRRYFIDWDYDFIKVDWCGGVQLGLSAKTRYTEIGKAINKIEEEIGKDKIYNICCWSFPGEWAVSVADSWRTGGDIFNNFGAVLEQLDNIKSLAKYNGPGHVNDLDMMQIGNGMSYEEDKTHFAMWCMMSTPLMLGMDLNSISEETLSIISNPELIALDQDPACVQATVAKTYGQVEAWVKDLGQLKSGDKAFAFLNRSDKEQTVFVDFEDLGLADVRAVRDLWSRTDLSSNGRLRLTIPAHGTLVYKASGRHIDVQSGSADIPTTDDGSVVLDGFSAETVDKPKNVNLTRSGSYDWMHTGNSFTRMSGGAEELSYFYEGSFCTYGNAAARYSWTNGDAPARASGDTSGIGVLGVGSYICVVCSADSNERTLSAAFGSYSADMEIELIVGGKTLYKESFRGGDSKKVDKMVTATFRTDRPTTAYLLARVTKNLGASQSVNLECAALNIKITDAVLKKPVFVMKDRSPSFEVPVCTPEDASLIVALREKDGGLLRFTSVDVKKGWGKYTVDPAFFGDFSGEADIYLWKENIPLTPAQSVTVEERGASEHGVGMMRARSLAAKGAILLDVRTSEEYASGHIEGALNLDYSKIAQEAEALLPDKDAPVIVYCAAAKRSSQAFDSLKKLGYKNVYNLGSMKNYYAEPMITFSTDTCSVLTAGDKVGVNFTCDSYDYPQVRVSVGKDSTFEDSLPLGEFTVPAVDAYYLTLKAYLAYDGVCYAECSKTFIYWSEDTVDAFAADLTWTKATIGWGSIGKNKSVGGKTLKLAGKTFAHGIGTHANSEIEMKIPAGAKKFMAVGGCDLEMNGNYSTMMLFVYIDGKLVDHSSLIKVGQHYVFDVDIPAGAETILLYAYEGTYGGNSCDHSDWCVAGFFDEVKEL